MELERWEILRSPATRGYTRLQGELVYEDRPKRSELIWLEVPERYSAHLSQTANPWLAILLPLAMTLGEPLRLPLPIDGTLMENASVLMKKWAEWYSDRRMVPIEVDGIQKSRGEPESNRSGLMFSGGVDSFFTVLDHDRRALGNSGRPIDDLIFAWGIDIPLDNHSAFHRASESALAVADELEKELIVLRTNARGTRLKRLRWREYFGALLIGLGLGLENRYAEIFLSSYGRTNPELRLGSNPLTDPLLSTRSTQVIHYGIGVNRIERTVLVSTSNLAMKLLRVCWESTDGVNCGNCEKCLRTMATLDVLGVLDQSEAFPAGSFSLKKLERAYSSELAIYLRDVQEHAVSRGRSDIYQAIEKSLARSERLDRWMRLPRMRQIGHHMKTSYPWLWRMVAPFRSVLKAVIRRATGASL
jgi:hypothetical protein